MRGSRIALLGLSFGLGLGAAACGAAAPRPTALPPPTGLAAAEATPTVHTLASGLRVVVVPAPAGVFEAALLFRGGALSDPPEAPGLTEWLPELALTGTSGDPDDQTPPERRALRAGAEVIAVADGRVAGWALAGAAVRAPELISLLADLARRPTLSATRLRIAGTLLRESIEAAASEEIEAAVGLAAGLATGRQGPLPLGPTSSMLSRLDREDVARHVRRVIRPERGVLVVGSDNPREALSLADGAFTGWEVAPTPSRESTVCEPRGLSAHLLLARDAPRTRAIILIAVPTSGPGGANRAATEALVAWAAERPNGPLHRRFDADQARRAAPQLVDLGGPGPGASLLLGGVAGEHTAALDDARTLLEVLSAPARPEPPAAEVLAASSRVAAAARAERRGRSLVHLVDQAAEALYGVAASNRDPLAGWKALGRDLAAWRATVVAIGTREFLEALAELGEVTVWSQEGEQLEGPGPPSCSARPGASRQTVVDTPSAHR